MRTETRIVRIGEHLGPVDRSYDFDQHKSGDEKWWPKRVETFISMLEAFEAGTPILATTDGGVPRFGWGDLLEVGMYDGWPFWKPVPSFLISSSLGGAEWHWFGSLSEWRIVERKPS